MVATVAVAAAVDSSGGGDVEKAAPLKGQGRRVVIEGGYGESACHESTRRRSRVRGFGGSAVRGFESRASPRRDHRP